MWLGASQTLGTGAVLVPNGPPGQALENGEGLSNRLMSSHVACYMRRQRHFDPGI